MRILIRIEIRILQIRTSAFYPRPFWKTLKDAISVIIIIIITMTGFASRLVARCFVEEFRFVSFSSAWCRPPRSQQRSWHRKRSPLKLKRVSDVTSMLSVLTKSSEFRKSPKLSHVIRLTTPGVFTARRYASAVYAVIVCLSVCPSIRPFVLVRTSVCHKF